MTMLSLPDHTEAAEYYFLYINQVPDTDICRVLETQAAEAVTLLEGISATLRLSRVLVRARARGTAPKLRSGHRDRPRRGRRALVERAHRRVPDHTRRNPRVVPASAEGCLDAAWDRERESVHGQRARLHHGRSRRPPREAPPGAIPDGVGPEFSGRGPRPNWSPAWINAPATRPARPRTIRRPGCPFLGRSGPANKRRVLDSVQQPHDAGPAPAAPSVFSSAEAPTRSVACLNLSPFAAIRRAGVDGARRIDASA